MPFISSARGAYGPQGQKVIKGPLAPVWTTSGTLTGATTSAYSYQLVATDDSGDAPTYALVSGALPTGMTLSSSGLISGTATGTSATYNFVVSATDVNGRATNSGTLTIVATLALIRAVDIYGAKGGEWTQGGNAGGYGGRVFGNVEWSTSNNPHYLLVGCMGGDDSGRGAPGGGGFSAIWYGNSNPASGTWVVGAGGGGGENAGDTGGTAFQGVLEEHP
jgi:hypothetical protein